LQAAGGLEDNTMAGLAAEVDGHLVLSFATASMPFLAEGTVVATKFNIVQIYEMSRERQLLSTQEKDAVFELLAKHQEPEDVPSERGQVACSQELVKLLKEHDHADAIPKHKVVEAFLQVMQRNTGSA
jgi:hypothetical protein